MKPLPMTTRLPRSTSRALPVLFLGFMLCIYHSSQAQQLIPGNISISPSEPTKSWNPARDLYPDESITLDVHVESTGTSGGKEWDLDPASTKIILNRANSLWTPTQGEDGDTDFTFEILSLGSVPSRHDVKVTATWKTPRQGGGGGGVGSETKHGSAEGGAYTNIPVFTWYFHSRLEFADGQSTIEFEAMSDANGASISLNNYTVHGNADWNIADQVNPADTITGSVDSDTPGKGKLRVTFDGNNIDESDDEIAFAKVNLAIASSGDLADLSEDRQPGGTIANPPHEMDPGGITFTPIKNAAGLEISPGKRAKLTLTGDGGQSDDGKYTLSKDNALTKVKIYDAAVGGNLVDLSQTYSTSQLANGKALYVGSEAFNPDDPVEEGILTLKYERTLGSDNVVEILQDQVKVTLRTVELRDVKDPGNTGDDVTITHWDKTAQTNPADGSIAWIEAHKSSTDAAPRMPQLVLKMEGLPHNITLEAKLIVIYQRPYVGKQADDTVKIPEDGSYQSVTNGLWEIYTQYEGLQFFGGDATLTYKINGGSEQKIEFAIGGRNPDDLRCKTYTQQGSPWYAYAIEKHESQAYNPGYYNQFWERHGNNSPINNGVNYVFTKGDSLVVRSPGETGVGGVGLAQVTGAGGNKNISAPREIFWNWQRNVDSFLGILAGKINLAETFMNDQTPREGPGSMPNGQRPQTTFHTGSNVAVPSRVQGVITFGDEQNNKRPEDAVAIKAYNGASSHWCSWRGPTVHEWQFNYGQNNYVVQVCNQIEVAQP